MKSKHVGLTVSLVLLLVVSSIMIGWAEVPSGLIIVRASDDSLWKATCLSGTCTAFSSFPGRFASQPTVYWDERWGRYVLWGRASNNTIWRSTFSSAGNFNNDWVSIPGLTASPIGAGGGYFPAGSNSVGAGSRDVATISDNCAAMTNLTSFSITPLRNGDVTAIASGRYSMTTDDKRLRICLSDVSGGDVTTCDSADIYLEPDNIGSYENQMPFALTERFGVTADVTKTIYLKACREVAGTGTVEWNDFIGVFTTREY